jgi:hypothetical protein
MSQDLDELFGEGGASLKPGTRTIIVLLTVGLVLAVVGLLCSSVPGGLFVLLAWTRVEKEVDRVESGFLPEEFLPQLKMLRRIVWIAFALIFFVFLCQAFLLITGFYLQLWHTMIMLLLGTA